MKACVNAGDLRIRIRDGEFAARDTSLKSSVRESIVLDVPPEKLNKDKITPSLP